MQCRASKARCTGGKPQCARCVQRAAACVYDEDSSPQWTRIVQPTRQSDVQTDASRSDSNDVIEEENDATPSRQVSSGGRAESPPVKMSIEQPSQGPSTSGSQQPPVRPAYPVRRPSSTRAFVVDEGSDSLEWYGIVTIANASAYPRSNIVAGYSNLSFQTGSASGCWSRSTLRISILYDAMRSYIGRPSFSGLMNPPMKITPGTGCFMSFVRWARSMFLFSWFDETMIDSVQILRFAVYQYPKASIFAQDTFCRQRMGSESSLAAFYRPRHYLRPESHGLCYPSVAGAFTNPEHLDGCSAPRPRIENRQLCKRVHADGTDHTYGSSPPVEPRILDGYFP